MGHADVGQRSPSDLIPSSAASGLAQGVEGRALMPVATVSPVEPVQQTHSVEQVVDIRISDRKTREAESPSCFGE